MRRYFQVGQVKFSPPPYLSGPYPQSAARFPYPHNYPNMGEQPQGVQVPYILWLLSPSGQLLAGGAVYNKETAEYVYNAWAQSYLYMPEGTERFMWRYSGTYDNAHLPRTLVHRAQLLSMNGTKYWHVLPGMYCSKTYCPT